MCSPFFPLNFVSRFIAWFIGCVQVLFFLILFNFSAFSQEEISPFAGIAVKEIIIPTAQQANIDLLLNDPSAPARCFRVYVCFNDPLWELQAIFSAPEKADWTLSSTTNKFYRHPLANELIGGNINPLFFEIWPELAYDSWFTINKYDNSGDDPSFLIAQTGPGPGPSEPPLPLNEWNNNAGNLDINNTTSYGGTVIVNTTGYPSTFGMPDDNNQVCIGQFTSDGEITGNINLQFRRLLPGGFIYEPTTVVKEFNVTFTAPGLISR